MLNLCHFVVSTRRVYNDLDYLLRESRAVSWIAKERADKPPRPLHPALVLLPSGAVLQHMRTRLYFNCTCMRTPLRCATCSSLASMLMHLSRAMAALLAKGCGPVIDKYVQRMYCGWDSSVGKKAGSMRQAT